jgi:pilus assembly protein FimV
VGACAAVSYIYVQSFEHANRTAFFPRRPRIRDQGDSMKTAVRRALLLSALMSPGALYGLGLGEIRLNSALNQPFDAEIELVSATAEDLGALRAALAPGDTFARYGLDRPAFLSEFSFRVARGAGGRDVLRVTSPRPVTEPFVTLLVEANWPRGRLLREYTVLLDPPVFAPAPAVAEAVVAPRVSTPAPRDTAPVATETGAVASRPVARAPSAAAGAAAGGTYQVRRNDTLWQIASSANPGTRSDVNRAMVAIYRENAAAFDGNINVLRSGSTLRIPDAAQIQAISASEAAAEVARQYDAWRQGATAPAVTPPPAAPAEPAGRLRLVPPEQGTAAPSTATAPATPAATAPGSATTGAAPGTPLDLEARIRQLEADLAEARRLVELRSADLTDLQATPPADSAPAEEATAAQPAPVEQPATEAAAEAAPTPPAAASGPTLVERLLEYWWALAGLLAAVLGIVLFRRLRSERGDAEEDLEAALGSRDLRTGGYTPRERESTILVEEKRATDDLRPATPAVVATAAAAAAATRRPASLDDTLAEAAGSSESGDPLAEADFHMAYGLYDQAADLVHLALRREPQRRDLKLKLLEIYFVWGNRDRFVEVARELDASRSEGPAGEWDKVLIMGKQIAPDEAMFAGSPSGADSLDMELHGATTSIDIDLAGGTVVPDVDVDLGEEIPRVERSGIDFILDEPIDATEGDTVLTPASGVGDTSLSPTIRARKVGAAEAAEATQELTVDRLGLDLDTLRALESLDVDADDGERDGAVEIAFNDDGGTLLEEADLLNATSLLRMPEVAGADGSASDADADVAVIDLTDATREMPLAPDLDLQSLKPTGQYDLGGEPATMSEVGTKLDLARAYMDMGDPEGARSILEEVLQEGNPQQRKEAERLVASLP